MTTGKFFSSVPFLLTSLFTGNNIRMVIAVQALFLVKSLHCALFSGSLDELSQHDLTQKAH